MADDELGNFERVLGAFANIVPDREEPVLTGVRCPKCDWTGFVRAEAAYDAAASRVVHGRSDPTAKYDGGLTDEEIIKRLAPPTRRSPIPSTLVAAAVLAGAAYYVNRRFGSNPGFVATLVAVVLGVVFLLTRARALSDGYYNGRARWRKLFMCRKCGQLVDS
jgi:hypothetical protein